MSDEQPILFVGVLTDVRSCPEIYSKTEASARLGLDEVASFLADCPSAEEFSRARLSHKRRIKANYATAEMISRSPSGPRHGQFFRGAGDHGVIATAQKQRSNVMACAIRMNQLARFSISKNVSEYAQPRQPQRPQPQQRPHQADPLDARVAAQQPSHSLGEDCPALSATLPRVVW